MNPEYKKYIDEKRYVEAAEVLYIIIKNKKIDDLDEEIESIDLFFKILLPYLINNEVVWLIKNPKYAKRYLVLCANAFEKEYFPSDMVFFAMHLRCYLAISDAVDKDVQGVHREVLYAADQDSIEKDIDPKSPVPDLERLLKDNVVNTATLTTFFAAYFEFLRQIGKEDIVEKIGWIIEKGIRELEKDETRAGIVKGLFIKEKEGTGVIRQLLVRVEEGEETVEYSHLSREKLGESLRDASDVTRKVVHECLIKNGYPEGLSGKKIIWQIVRSDAKAEEPNTLYDGSSICLPLAICIISFYLGQPVASDIAVTGAFNIHSVDEGRVLGVAGILAKIESALRSGVKKVFIPTINIKNVDLASMKKAEELNAEVIGINSLSEIYEKLFVKRKNRSFKSINSDAIKGILRIIGIKKSEAQSPFDYVRYRAHILVSSSLLCVLFVLDGFGLHFIFNRKSLSSALIMIAAGTFIVFLSLLYCYSLATHLIEREIRSAWKIGMAISFFGMSSCFFIFLPMIPLNAGQISKIYDWPPFLGTIKDFIIFWMFASLYLSNLYVYVSSLNHLIKRRQFRAVIDNLDGQDEAEAILPSRVLRLKWKDALLAATIVGFILLMFEMYYYVNLRPDLTISSYVAVFGVPRDIIFIILAAEVLIWYKSVLAEIKKKAIR
jgi:hypothetical protein